MYILTVYDNSTWGSDVTSSSTLASALRMTLGRKLASLSESHNILCNSCMISCSSVSYDWCSLTFRKEKCTCVLFHILLNPNMYYLLPATANYMHNK